MYAFGRCDISPLSKERNQCHTQRICAFTGGQLSQCMVLDVVRLVRRAIRFCRGGELPDGINDVRTAQLDNYTSQRGMISQAHSMTVNCFHGGKQYTELYRRCTSEILLTICLSHSRSVITSSMPNIPYLHSLPFSLCVCIYYEPRQECM